MADNPSYSSWLSFFKTKHNADDRIDHRSSSNPIITEIHNYIVDNGLESRYGYFDEDDAQLGSILSYGGTDHLETTGSNIESLLAAFNYNKSLSHANLEAKKSMAEKFLTDSNYGPYLYKYYSKNTSPTYPAAAIPIKITANGSGKINANTLKILVKDIIRLKVVIYNSVNSRAFSTFTPFSMDDTRADGLAEGIVIRASSDFVKAINYACGFDNPNIPEYDDYFDLNINTYGNVGKNVVDFTGMLEAYIDKKYLPEDSTVRKASYGGYQYVPIHLTFVINVVMTSILYAAISFQRLEGNKATIFDKGLSLRTGTVSSTNYVDISNSSFFRDWAYNVISTYHFGSAVGKDNPGWKLRTTPHATNFAIDYVVRMYMDLGGNSYRYGKTYSSSSHQSYEVQMTYAFLITSSTFTDDESKYSYFIQNFMGGFSSVESVYDIPARYMWVVGKFVNRVIAYPSISNHLHIDWGYLRSSKNFNTHFNKRAVMITFSSVGTTPKYDATYYEIFDLGLKEYGESLNEIQKSHSIEKVPYRLTNLTDDYIRASND